MHVSLYMIVATFAMLGALLAFFVMLATVPPLLYGLLARRPRRGYIAGRIALWMAGLAVAISVPLWIIAARLHLEGTSLHQLDPTLPPFGVFAGMELGVLAVAALVFARRRRLYRAAGISSRP